MKRRLMDRERQIPGRALLPDFYMKGREAEFTETVEYLRELGALDESDPKMPPSVVVSTYISGKANCLGMSSFYQICCLDECEGLMEHLDRGIVMLTAILSGSLLLLDRCHRIPCTRLATCRPCSGVVSTDQPHAAFR